MTQRISLRIASPSDEPFLLQLRKLTMTEHLERASVSTDDETHYQRIRSNFEDAKVICEADERIGLLKLTRTSDEWHLHQIQVLPSHQGRGIGQSVLRTILADAKHAGVSVSLSVLHGNPARRLYERLGFEPVAETPTDAKLLWRS